MTVSSSVNNASPAKSGTPLKLKPPVYTSSIRTSLSKRIVLAMVIVTVLSAILSGIFYQLRASRLVDQANQQVAEVTRQNTLARLENSRLPDRLKQDLIDTLELRPPAGRGTGKAVVNLALDQAVGAVLVVALGAGALAFVVGWLLTRRIVGPLEKLRLASQRVASGDYNGEVKVNGSDEVGQVAYSFNFMLHQLRDAESRRRDLLSDVAHELKTPLASIQGHIEALRDNLPRAKADPQSIYQVVLEDVAELDQMVGSLRTWLSAQGMLDRLELKPLPLGEELQTLVQRFQPQADNARIRLELKLDRSLKPALADRNALRHIVSNLLDNALRYTPAGGTVQVLAWQGEGENPGQGPATKITLAVADSGVGIAREHWPFIFERFYRVDKSRTRDTGGTGLGLSLVRDLAEAQGGRVWLNSQVGKGTIFYVSLPAAS
ncbi:MAG TPA: HAMP domain-containing sensor histidine kinase [Chloroflexia bacterium]|nr:HAMP domain-containing sensor histidine kinase [Chloroflexia bacterium]